jgi:hypothetical protein
MDNVTARTLAAALGIAAASLLAGCGDGGEAKFRLQLDPVVAKVTETATSAAALTGQAPAAIAERSKALLTDIAGLGADLKALPAEGEKQQGLVAAGQAYLSATQRFVAAQQEFAGAYARLEASRVKVRESLDAKVRTSKFSMDFWKESHDRLVIELDNFRKECEQGKARVEAATASLAQSAEAAGAALGREKLISAAQLEAHRKALDAVNLAKGA